MKCEEVFTGAGVTARSHTLAVARRKECVVFASSIHLVVQSVPNSSDEVGRNLHVSEVRHSTPISVVKRLKSVEDIFVSGGTDGRVCLWKLGECFEYIAGLSLCVKFLDGCDESVVSVCGVVRGDEAIVFAAIGGSKSEIHYWFISIEEMKWTVKHSDFVSTGIVIPLASDAHFLKSLGSVILAVGTSKRTIDLYSESNQSFAKLISVVAHNDWIHSVAFNDSDENLLLASAGQDTYVKLWRIAPETENEDHEELSVTKNKFSIEMPDQSSVAMSFNVEAVLAGHEDWVHSTEWDTTGKMLITASSDKSVIAWMERDGLWNDVVRVGIVGGQAAGFFSSVITADGSRLIASSYFGGLHAWKCGKEIDSMWQPMTMCGGHNGEVRDVDWEQNGNYLLSAGKDATTRIYSAVGKTFAEISRPQVHGHEMQCVASVSAACFVSGAEEKIFRAFSAPQTFANSLCAISGLDKKEVFGDIKFEDFGARVPALGLSNKAIEAGAGDEGEETHWEEVGFQASPANLSRPPTEDCLQQNTLWPELHKLYGHGFEVYAVSRNPNGTVLATSCKASQSNHAAILLWKVADWSKQAVIEGHQLTVTQIEWSPDGRWLLTVSRDRTVVLYKELDGNQNGFNYAKVWSSAKEHSRIVWACSWLSDSKNFVTVSRDMKVILWTINELGTATLKSSLKLQQPITAVSAGKGELRNLLACGLQDGSIQYLTFDNDQLSTDSAQFTPHIAIDSPVLRLRFHPKLPLLAIAGTDGKTRILRIQL